MNVWDKTPPPPYGVQSRNPQYESRNPQYDLQMTPGGKGDHYITGIAKPKRKSKKWFVVLLAGVSFVTVAGAVGFFVFSALTANSEVAGASCPEPGIASKEINDGTVAIKVSETGKLCTLSLSDGSNGMMITVARSYDNGNWEAITPEAGLGIECSGDSCNIQLPQTGSYFLTGYSRSLPSDKSFSRFLNQVSFGPTRAELLQKKSYRDYIKEQMEEPATLHRQYYRERVNPRTVITSGVGRPRKPCETNSRWHQHAFQYLDKGKQVVASASSNSNFYTLKIDNIVRTDVPRGDWPLALSTSYEICDVKETVGGRVTLGVTCSSTTNMDNPEMYFSNPNDANVAQFIVSDVAELKEIDPNRAGVKLLEIIPPSCTSNTGPSYIRSVEGDYYMHDPRLVLLDNDLENPYSSGSVACPNVPMTFLNIDSCVTGENACITATFNGQMFRLTSGNIKKFFTLSQKRVHAINGFSMAQVLPPCTKGEKSRWVSTTGVCANPSTNIDSPTLQTLKNLIRDSSDSNNRVRDIIMPLAASCTDNTPKGVFIEITHPDGVTRCWGHKHPETFNVYDFTSWKGAHPGDSAKEDAISQWADNGNHILTYPVGSHTMDPWLANKNRFPYLGRLQDDIDFASLDESLQTVEMANELGVTSNIESKSRACGSPGEIKSNPELGSRFGMQQTDRTDLNQVEGRFDHRFNTPNHIKDSIWFMISLFSKDQLRQRMAWALSQIIVVTAFQTDVVRNTENFINFYDIFVRNAFGNFKDILREVSFNPMMAEMLTYRRGESFAYVLEKDGKKEFPDENYAREVMQLFTIGLFKLNPDGTIVRQNGVPVQSYTNEDIITFSRAWTGFNYQDRRENYETERSDPNKIDPLLIEAEKRDVFPKMDLNKGYIGDTYPLCADLPDRAFLRIGATFRFLGDSGSPELQTEADPRDSALTRISLETASLLYQKLCQAGDDGKCNYKSVVKLEENLSCRGVECRVDTVTTVKVGDFFFEYVRIPCVELPFFTNGKKIMEHAGNNAMCANPKLAVATQACCPSGSTRAIQKCEYHGERLTYQSAKANCANNEDTCDFTVVDEECDESPRPYLWSSVSCQITVKIKNDGKVAVVHNPSETTIRNYLKEDTENFFRVNWLRGTFPSENNNCNGSPDCTKKVMDEESYCICSIAISEKRVFSAMTSREQVLSSLFIGAPPVEMFDAGTYVLSASSADVKVYSLAGENQFTKKTIFEIRDRQNNIRFYYNIKSDVQVPGTSASFRNPPTFMSFVKASQRDAFYETEAVLDHYFTHDNTAPFIATRLIQRFVTSNPSPSYVRAVADAFKTGSFQYIGDGKYGDLAATVAAILLHKEARSVVLDEDPTAGQLREPLLKLLHFMRSMELNSDGREIEFRNLDEMIGQRAYFSPTVFSFFLPEFAPPGEIKSASLAAPEAQVLTTPFIVKYINGMTSLARYGLAGCDGGFGYLKRGGDCPAIRNGQDEFADARLTFTPKNQEDSKAVVDELDLLLTNGRLSEASRNIMQEAYENELGKSGPEAALKILQQLFVLSPEFQITNTNRPIGAQRKPAPAQQAKRDYKAIVYLFLKGAADSFNILVPHTCSSGKVSYAQYSSVRGSKLAHSKAELLQIQATNQVCSTFGIHPELTFLQDLYNNEKSCIFTANVGPLLEPVTKKTFEEGGVKLPPNLFAHNHQQRATQSVDPENPSAAGVLGRIEGELAGKGFVTRSFSLTNEAEIAVTGEAGKAPPLKIVSASGIDVFEDRDQTLSTAMELTSISQSMFGETWSELFQQAINGSKELRDKVVPQTLDQNFPDTKIGEQLEMVSKLIKARGDESERDIFFVDVGGWDTHNDAKETVGLKLKEINAAMSKFVAEMKSQGEWNNVVLLTASDFGRKLTSNGVGTDHGWGGNYWVIGGDIDGGKVLGSFPDDLSEKGARVTGNGRVLPTTPWEAVWNAVSTWFGVESNGLNSVLPNLANFPNSMIFDKQDLFK